MPVLIPDVRSRRGPVGGGTILQAFDTFTDVDGTAVTSHTPSSGGTWTKNSPSNNTAAPSIDSNRLHGENAASTSLYYHSFSAPSADYDVSADVVMRSDNNASVGGVAARMAIGANTYYAAKYSTASNAWQLTGIVAGVVAFTTLSSVQVLTVDLAYRVKLSVRGAALTLSVNGTPILSTTDAGITAKGQPAVVFNSAATSTTGVHLDYWEVAA